MSVSRFPYRCPKSGLLRGCSINNTFRKQLDRIKTRLKRKDQDFQMLMIGNEGCLDGETKIVVNKEKQKNKKIKLKDLYKFRNENPKVNLFVKSFDGKVIKPYRIKDVLYSGKKRLYFLRLKDGKNIQATLSHKFFTKDNGWVKLKNLKTEDKIIVNNKNSKPSFSRVKSITKLKTKDVYDIEMEEYPNFLANDIIVHNSGKSVLGFQICSYIDPTFNLDRVCFSAEDFKNKVMKGKPGQAFMLDESSDLSIRSSLSKLNKMMINLMAQQRQLRLFCLIVIPSVHMLERYAALHRSEAAIYTEIGIKSGRHIFNYLNRENKLRVILEGKKTMDPKKVILKYRDDIPYATFTNSYANIDEDLYRFKKLEEFRKMGEDDFDVIDKGLTLRNEIIYRILHKEYELNSYKIAELFLKHDISLSRSGIRDILKKQEKEEKIEDLKKYNLIELTGGKKNG